MRKKRIISLAVITAAAFVPMTLTAQTEVVEQVTEVAVPCEDGTDAGNCGVCMTVEQTVWEDTPATDIDAQELDRKAKQQEKARNAAENDSWGGAITLIAMCIVVMALAVLSVLFLIFGKVSTYMQKIRKRKAHGVSANIAEVHHDEVDSGEAIAAISMALAEHMGQGHDIEDTILTIRRMRKAYSPWNSKIYNLRVVPEHTEARLHRGLKK